MWMSHNQKMDMDHKTKDMQQGCGRFAARLSLACFKSSNFVKSIKNSKMNEQILSLKCDYWHTLYLVMTIVGNNSLLGNKDQIFHMK